MYEKHYRDALTHEIDDSKSSHQLLLELCIKAKQRAVSDKTNKYLLECGVHITGKKFQKNRETEINKYFDTLQKKIFDAAFVDLVATFEKVVFPKVSNATGGARQIINKHYLPQDPFHVSIPSFIKDTNDINKLADILSMLSGKISSDLYDKFREINDYRNRIAHGRRFGSETTLTLDDVARILDEIIRIVG